MVKPKPRGKKHVLPLTQLAGRMAPPSVSYEETTYKNNPPQAEKFGLSMKNSFMSHWIDRHQVVDLGNIIYAELKHVETAKKDLFY